MKEKKISTFAIADALELKIRGRDSNRAAAAKIFKDFGCLYSDYRTVKIVDNSISILIGKFMKNSGSAALTCCSASIGKMTANVFGLEVTTGKQIQIGDFIITVLVELELLKLTRDDFWISGMITSWHKDGTKTKQKRSRSSWSVEPGVMFSEIKSSSKERDGISIEKYNNWFKGRRIVDGVRQTLVKSNVEITENHQGEEFMGAVNVLENTRWSINKEVAKISSALKAELISTVFIVKDIKGNNVEFYADDITRYSTNKHLKGVDLMFKGSLFEPHRGDLKKVDKQLSVIKQLNKKKADNTEAKAKLDKLSLLWAQKKHCLGVSSKAARDNMIIETIHGSRDEKGWKDKSFFMSVYLDYRGRVYNKESYLSFQSSDLSKGHMQFNTAKQMTTEGLEAFFMHASCSYNQSYTIDELLTMDLQFDYIEYLTDNDLDDISIDKMGKNDRYNWTYDNIPMMLEIADDPIANKDRWFDCEKPWVFLQCCFEMKAIEEAILTNTEHLSNIIVSIDGSNNGLQHLSAMTKDEKAGCLVGLVPTDFPKDFYVMVMQGIESGITETELGKRISKFKMKDKRKGIAKRGTMTRHYDAGRKCIAETIELDSYSKVDVDMGITSDDAFILAGGLIKAYNKLCEKPMQTKVFLQKLVTHRLTQKLSNTVDWTSPSGFPIKTEKFVSYDRMIQGRVCGNKIGHIYKEYTETPMTAEHLSAIGANIVHSYDAAHMVKTINLMASAGFTDFAPVHDSFGVHAEDVCMLEIATKTAFIEIYKGDVLNDLKTQLVYLDDVDDAIMPETGTLDLDWIYESDFFFA